MIHQLKICSILLLHLMNEFSYLFFLLFRFHWNHHYIRCLLSAFHLECHQDAWMKTLKIYTNFHIKNVTTIIECWLTLVTIVAYLHTIYINKKWMFNWKPFQNCIYLCIKLVSAVCTAVVLMSAENCLC